MEATLTAPATTTWNIDAAHTHVEFAVKHMMISTVKGRFAGVQGTVTTPSGDFADATVDVTIDVASIDTRQEQRDGHLRSADFFDAENHPVIRGLNVPIKSFRAYRYAAPGPPHSHFTEPPTAKSACHSASAIGTAPAP